MAHRIGRQASGRELAEAADENFVIHASWSLRRTEGMRVQGEPDIVLTDSGLPCDTFNIACRTRLDAAHAPQRIRAAIDFFRQTGRPFSWWMGPGDQPPNLGALLVEAGLQQAETELAMAADLTALPEASALPNGLNICRVRRASELADFARTIGGVEERRFYAQTASALLSPNAPQWFYVGYLNAKPVATAELTVGGGVAGLYNISTLEAYRRRGLGTAMTLLPLLDARDNGMLTGVLQAAAAGVNLYTRLGFQTFGSITEYKPLISGNCSV